MRRPPSRPEIQWGPQPTGFEDDDPFPVQPGRIQEGQRHTGGLASARRGLQYSIPAVAQGTAHIIKNSGYRENV